MDGLIKIIEPLKSLWNLLEKSKFRKQIFGLIISAFSVYLLGPYGELRLSKMVEAKRNVRDLTFEVDQFSSGKLKLQKTVSRLESGRAIASEEIASTEKELVNVRRRRDNIQIALDALSLERQGGDVSLEAYQKFIDGLEKDLSVMLEELKGIEAKKQSIAKAYADEVRKNNGAFDVKMLSGRVKKIRDEYEQFRVNLLEEMFKRQDGAGFDYEEFTSRAIQELTRLSKKYPQLTSDLADYYLADPKIAIEIVPEENPFDELEATYKTPSLEMLGIEREENYHDFWEMRDNIWGRREAIDGARRAMLEEARQAGPVDKNLSGKKHNLAVLAKKMYSLEDRLGVHQGEKTRIENELERLKQKLFDDEALIQKKRDELSDAREKLRWSEGVYCVIGILLVLSSVGVVVFLVWSGVVLSVTPIKVVKQFFQ